MSSVAERERWERHLARVLDAFPTAGGATGSRLAMAGRAYGTKDIAAAAVALLDGWPTMGASVRRVEEAFARATGASHSLMTSSGGGANLLIFLYLTSPAAPKDLALHPGDEVILPALGWSTTVTPLLATGCVPVFVDVSRRNYGLDPTRLAEALSERTRAVVAVHSLGVPCEIAPIRDFCRSHGLLLVEDCCEAIGSAVGEQSVGTFGDYASFSFYFSHQVTAVEGGMIVTPHAESAAVLKAMRNNGYRVAPNERQETMLPWWEEPTLFSTAGFNFKPTDVGAALLRGQLDRLASLTNARAALAAALTDRLDELGAPHLSLPTAPPRCTVNWLGYPLLVRESAPFERADVCRRLAREGIESRPIICGNLAAQPFLRDYQVRRGPLPEAEMIHERGLMVGLHPGPSSSRMDHLVQTIEDFLGEHHA